MRFESLIIRVSVLTLWITIVVAAWIFLPGMGYFISTHPAFYPAATVSMSVLMLSLACVLLLETNHLRTIWLRRTAFRSNLPDLNPDPLICKILVLLPDPLDWIWQPLWKTETGRRMADTWSGAQIPWRISRYPTLLVILGVISYLIGSSIAGPLVGSGLAIGSTGAIVRGVRSLADQKLRQIDEQVPDVLDSIAAGISSGQSFQLAVHALAHEATGSNLILMEVLSIRLQLGTPIEEALQRLLAENHQAGLTLAVEGILLQRQYGGDLVRMLDDVSALLRKKHELEHDVRAITAQGRLSGAIVSGLVPVSAGVLLLFNPGYLDILFDTLIGQILVLLTFTFQVAGWYLISRLVRVRY